MDEEAIAALAQHIAPLQSEGVWPRHVPAVTAFLCVATQWRTASVMSEFGGRVMWVGLDYAGARTALDALDMEITPSLWSELAAIEAGALHELNRAER